MRILHLMSCGGWSSDAYWAARVSRELGRRGHAVTLGCRVGTEAKVIGPARAEGIEDIVTLALPSGVRPAADAGDLRQLRRWLTRVDVVHVHRSKEHWLAAMANRLSPTPRPLVREVLLTAWDAVPGAHSLERRWTQLRARLRPTLVDVLRETHEI